MQMLTAGAALLVGALLRGETADFTLAQVTMRSLAAFIYLVFIGAIVGYNAYLWLWRYCPPAQVATYAYVNPVVAVLLGAGFAGEKLTSSMLAGAALIVAAVALVITNRPRGKLPPDYKSADGDAASAKSVVVTGTTRIMLR